MENEKKPEESGPNPSNDDAGDELDETDFEIDHPTRAEALSLLADFEPRSVPEELHSAFTERAFEKCLLCDGLLDEDPHGYQIQKSYRRKEVIVEFAICGSCAVDLCAEYSQESLRTLESFFMTLFSNLDQDDGRCHACERSRGNFDAHSSIGICRHEHIVFPIIRMCGKCEEGLHEKLSKKTRDLFGDFFRDNFPTVPEGIDLSPVKIF